MLSYQTKYLAHFPATIKLQVNIVLFVPLKSADDEVQDQIFMYKSNETSREKGMLRNWDLQELYIKKLGFCSYCSIKKSNIAIYNDTKKCFICSWSFKLNHIRQCKAINSNCLNCVTASHFAKACSQEKTTIDIKDKIIDSAKSNSSDTPVFQVIT